MAEMTPYQRAIRARDALQAATEKLNEALKLAETTIAERIGSGSARVILALPPPANKRERRPPQVPAYLLYKNGHLYVESGFPGKPRELKPILRASREMRVVAAGLIPELWRTLGGTVPGGETP